MPNIAIITCAVLPEPDPDQVFLTAALEKAGIQSQLLAWDGANSLSDKQLGAFDLCILRSCWNYFERPDAFMDWLEKAAVVTELLNPADVVKWNLHKGYLRSLETAGVPVVPTEWFTRGEAADLKQTMQTRGWKEVVIKPAVSAGSFSTKRFGTSKLAAGHAFLESLVSERDAMVQRYMPSVENPGEKAIVWIDGVCSHAVVKQPRFSEGDESVSAALPVSKEEATIAEQAIASVCSPEKLLYARVDVVEDDNGKLLVSELELIEPSLFFMQCPAALERFVTAIGRQCKAFS